jgi:hypothetical protein
MRQMKNKNPYMEERIRPLKVIDSLKYLILQPAYVDEKVVLSTTWQLDDNTVISTERHEDTREDDVQNIESSENIDHDPLELEADETLLINSIYAKKFAPGENRQPIGILMDSNAEELSFPTIFCGQKKTIPEGLSYGAVAKAYIRNYDRRCASNVTYLLYVFKTLQTYQLAKSINFCLKKCLFNKSVLTAGQIKNENFFNDLLLSDHGYSILKPLRNSPAFWEDKKKQIKAMIRQLGLPTVFLTLSAAETKWTELLVILYKIKYGQAVTEEYAQQLTYAQKVDLIKSDPVTCSRYFYYRINLLLKKVIFDKCGTFSKSGHDVVDFYWRIEFQQRGSPHLHSIIWLKDAPIYEINNPQSKLNCINFIEKFITCHNDPNYGFNSTRNLIGYQLHKHSNTCLKGKRSCRFNIPQPMFNKTHILEPLGDDFDKERKKELKKKFKKIKLFLEHIHKQKLTINFEQLLTENNLNYEEYILSIRSSITKDTIFLKRNSDEIYLNCYNLEILRHHQANMDIQFILDPYACASYVVNYINKSHNGTGKLMRQILEDLKLGNNSIRKSLNIIASSFINASEVSAQEAAFQILSLPVSMATRTCMFINTNEPDKRIRMLKTHKNLSKLDDDSSDIFNNNFIDYYIARPDELNNICLAHFCANYDFSKTAKIDKKQDKSYVDNENKDSDANDHEVYDLDDLEIDTDEKTMNSKSKSYLYSEIHSKIALLFYVFKNPNNHVSNKSALFKLKNLIIIAKS